MRVCRVLGCGLAALQLLGGAEWSRRGSYRLRVLYVRGRHLHPHAKSAMALLLVSNRVLTTLICRPLT